MPSFLQLVEDLLSQPSERSAYLADPGRYLTATGFDDFGAADLELSLRLSADGLPHEVARLIDPAAGLETLVSVDIDVVSSLSAGTLLLDDLEVDRMGDVDAPISGAQVDAELDGDIEFQVDHDVDRSALREASDEVDPEDHPLTEIQPIGAPDPLALTDPSADAHGAADELFDSALGPSGLDDDLDPPGGLDGEDWDSLLE